MHRRCKDSSEGFHVPFVLLSQGLHLTIVQDENQESGTGAICVCSSVPLHPICGSSNYSSVPSPQRSPSHYAQLQSHPLHHHPKPQQPFPPTEFSNSKENIICTKRWSHSLRLSLLMSVVIRPRFKGLIIVSVTYLMHISMLDFMSAMLWIFRECLVEIRLFVVFKVWTYWLSRLF